MDQNLSARRIKLEWMKSNEVFNFEDKIDEKKIIVPQRSALMLINIEKSKQYQKRLALKLQ